MSLNSAIRTLYSNPRTVYQYRENITHNPDPLYLSNKELYKNNSLYIEIPSIPEIIILSDITVNTDVNYEIIADKRILGNVQSILVKKYHKVIIHIYDIKDFQSLKISFDVTLAKPSVRSCL